MSDIRAVVLSGPSGSGKSTAIKALEDLGYYCVDNMPVALLPKFMELLATSGEIARVATSQIHRGNRPALTWGRKTSVAGKPV